LPRRAGASSLQRSDRRPAPSTGGHAREV